MRDFSMAGMNSMGQSIAGVLLLLLSSGWLEVATARPDHFSHARTLNRTLIEKYGAECDSSSLSVRLSTYCDVMDDSPTGKCCDSIFATLGRKNCLCKVVREPNYRSSSISGGNMIVDLYRACDGGPYISPTMEEDCDDPGRQPPPTPPQPPTPSTLEDDLTGRLSFWKKVGWTFGSLLVLLLFSLGIWIIWKLFGCGWFRCGRGYRLGGGEPEPNWWSCLKEKADLLWNRICQLGHDAGGRAKGWWASITTEAAETTAPAPPTWNVINILVCKFGFAPKIKEQDPTAAPGILELPAFLSLKDDMPSTVVHDDGDVEEAPGTPLLR